MHILYLDDSGGVADPSQKYFVLGGICVPELSIRWLSNRLEELAATFDADDPANVEFHAAEMFRGKVGVWKELGGNGQRINAIKSVLGVLNGAFREIVVMACAVHKPSFPDADPALLAYEQIATCFHNYLRHRYIDANTEQKGIVVLDKTSYEHSLQTLAAEFRRTGTRRGNQLRNICEVPLFVDSKASRLIQLADHIAYAVFRRYNANDLTYFNCIEDRFDRDDGTGVLHGLIHRERNRTSCTCPACLSRRTA